MIGFHRRYVIGDPPEQWPRPWTLTDVHEAAANLHRRGVTDITLADALVELLAQVYGRHGFVWLPLYLFDHSGLYLTTSREECRMFDPHGWDWGCVGVIYAPREHILREYGRKRLTRKLRRRVEEVLAGEVEVYAHYLAGEVYVVDDDAEGPVGGYYGWEEALKEARRRVGLQEE